MMDSPSLAIAIGLSNWPGPSPWEPQASTYSKGGGAGGGDAVCAGREQAAATAEVKSRNGRTWRTLSDTCYVEVLRVPSSGTLRMTACSMAKTECHWRFAALADAGADFRPVSPGSRTRRTTVCVMR